MTAPAIATVTAGIMPAVVSAAVVTSGNARRVVVGITVNDLASRGRFVRPDADEHGEQYEYDGDAEHDHDYLQNQSVNLLPDLSLTRPVVTWRYFAPSELANNAIISAPSRPCLGGAICWATALARLLVS